MTAIFLRVDSIFLTIDKYESLFWSFEEIITSPDKSHGKFNVLSSGIIPACLAFGS